MRQSLLTFFACLLVLISVATCTPLVYRPYKLPQAEYPTYPSYPTFQKRGNAELINGLLGMDFNKLNAIGKRSNAELINGLIGMDLNHLSSIGRR